MEPWSTAYGANMQQMQQSGFEQLRPQGWGSATVAMNSQTLDEPVSDINSALPWPRRTPKVTLFLGDSRNHLISYDRHAPVAGETKSDATARGHAVTAPRKVIPPNNASMVAKIADALGSSANRLYWPGPNPEFKFDTSSPSAASEWKRSGKASVPELPPRQQEVRRSTTLLTLYRSCGVKGVDKIISVAKTLGLVRTAWSLGENVSACPAKVLDARVLKSDPQGMHELPVMCLMYAFAASSLTILEIDVTKYAVMEADHAGHVLVKGTTALIDLAETASGAEKGTSAPIDEVRTHLFLIPETTDASQLVSDASPSISPIDTHQPSPFTHTTHPHMPTQQLSYYPTMSNMQPFYYPPQPALNPVMDMYASHNPHAAYLHYPVVHHSQASDSMMPPPGAPPDSQHPMGG
ncbi:hypothetical protein EYR40_008604 [Pleurotus pulmonarius]|nr:hypothetical protein EYR40_008604 [Pleurotus pulmonarius]